MYLHQSNNAITGIFLRHFVICRIVAAFPCPLLLERIFPICTVCISFCSMFMFITSEEAFCSWACAGVVVAPFPLFRCGAKIIKVIQCCVDSNGRFPRHGRDWVFLLPSSLIPMQAYRNSAIQVVPVVFENGVVAMVLLPVSPEPKKALLCQ